ncbi:piggyBac transposable element-derived protein 4-like [Xyrichtys novacula]|uniref:PiggyBac transposable element-derived protein 4-like n=1 Tax=Xyrichtys novacula TaxID=13765 RepID=A0AAV1HPA8_XYRNO|nr:piggyBac transposable element-derived protein 4-like [Xyrichtys novacula]
MACRATSRNMDVSEALELFLNDEETDTASSVSDSSSSAGDEMEDAFDPENQENSDEYEGDDEEMEVEGGVPEAGMIPKNRLTWSRTTEETLRYHPPAIPHPGITRHAAARITALDDSLWFFLTEEIMEILVLETNREGRRNDNSWRITDVTEIRTYNGLLFLAGLHRARHEATVSLWGEDNRRPIFRATMSRKRFDELCINLRFGNRETRRPHDKFAPISNLWKRWVDRLHMGHNLEAGAAPQRQVGKEVVLEPTEGLSGHTITVDNFFTSYDLAMVRTIQRNKPEVPSQLTNTRGREPDSSLFGFQPTATLVSFVPKRNRNVLLLSTRHRDGKGAADPPPKPEMIKYYKSCKGGVDALDQRVNTYGVGKKTKRWPLALFFNILNVSALNAFILWRQVDPGWNRGKRAIRQLFLQDLGSLLVQPLIGRRLRVPRSPAAAAIVERARGARESGPAPPADPEAPASWRGICHLCTPLKSKARRSCAKCGLFSCKEHTLNVCTACK